MATIMLEVDQETATHFQQSTPEDRQKIELLLKLQMREKQRGDLQSLEAFSNELSDKVQKRGLTPEILTEILDD